MRATAKASPVRSQPQARQQLWLVVGVLVVVVLATWFADTNLNLYKQQLFVLSAIWAIVAVALALTSGFTGVFSLGQIGFLAIGAYVSAILFMPPMVTQPMLLS